MYRMTYVSGAYAFRGPIRIIGEQAPQPVQYTMYSGLLYYVTELIKHSKPSNPPVGVVFLSSTPALLDCLNCSPSSPHKLFPLPFSISSISRVERVPICPFVYAQCKRSAYKTLALVWPLAQVGGDRSSNGTVC